MEKCKVCGKPAGDWSMQPFGPGEKTEFMAQGWHYRGFPVYAVCSDCKNKIQGESQPRLSLHVGERVYVFTDQVASESPF